MTALSSISLLSVTTSFVVYLLCYSNRRGHLFPLLSLHVSLNAFIPFLLLFISLFANSQATHRFHPIHRSICHHSLILLSPLVSPSIPFKLGLSFCHLLPSTHYLLSFHPLFFHLSPSTPPFHPLFSSSIIHPYTYTSHPSYLHTSITMHPPQPSSTVIR